MTPDKTQTLLNQLKDIHYPDPISVWPLALGWWIVIVVCLILMIALAVGIRYYISGNRYRWQALKALDKLAQTEPKPENYADTLAHLIKRTLIHAPKNSRTPDITSMEDFKTFLTKSMPEEDAELLAISRYKKCGTANNDTEHLTNSVRQWIKQHKL